MRLYRALGGVLEEPGWRSGPWDCVLSDGLIIELDEGQHFNRYRRLTLKTEWAQQLPWDADYLDYCTLYEGTCSLERGWGAYWTSKTTERMFGRAGAPRMLNGAGSPCWKHRALDDAIRDLAALGGSGIRLARLAVYDMVGDAQLDDVLDGKAELDREALRTLITERTIGG